MWWLHLLIRNEHTLEERCAVYERLLRALGTLALVPHADRALPLLLQFLAKRREFSVYTACCDRVGIIGSDGVQWKYEGRGTWQQDAVFGIGVYPMNPVRIERIPRPVGSYAVLCAKFAARKSAS